MDGAYINGHIREKNKNEDRIARRLAENQKPTKRCVLVMRQKNDKTLTFVAKSENQADVVYLADRFVKKDLVICADESPAYDVLHAKFDTRRVNHAKEYRSLEGRYH
jgi:hypothetical protein